MPPLLKGAVRRSQLVTTYGVGSIVAIGDESFMVAGIDRWPTLKDDETLALHEPRLERRLGVTGFREPPATDRADVPVVRFPRWCSCPKCRRLDTHRRLAGGFDSNHCTRCNRVLVPSRFIVVCSNGHIDDFPYMRWVHDGRPADSQAHALHIDARGATAALSDVVIRCSCGCRRSMDGAFDRNAFQGVATCLGKRPWLKDADEDCGTVLRTLQRGASNVWFGSMRSAISIPPWSEAAFQKLNKYWEVLRIVSDGELASVIGALGLETQGLTVQDLIEAVRERRGTATGPQTEDEFRRQEYEALRRGTVESVAPQQFVAEAEDVPEALRPWLSRVVLVKRLREVRALEGFARLVPPAYGSELAPLAATDPGWRPAVEVKGEGVFLVLDEEQLRSWEIKEPVRARADWLNDQYRRRAEAWGHDADRSITPRLLLAHTFAHALINQFSLDAGYPAASLRERLYVFDDAVAILVYTSTSDSAGSLGGLIAQGRPANLESALRDAVARYSWCSTDPVCIEATAGGADALNLAACHACALLPETSCELMNVLLDRAMIVGTPKDAEIGFLSDLTGA